MKRIWILGLSLAVAAAFGAIIVASASAALPEWGKCEQVPVVIKGKTHAKGKYGNANCTEPGTEYEFIKGEEAVPGGLGFTAVQTSEKAELETAQGIAVTCESTEAHGYIHGTKEVSDVEVTFKGCELGLLNFTCESVFESNENPEEEFGFFYHEGEIATRELKGKLVYDSGKGTESPQVGLELLPAEKGGLFAEFLCGARPQKGQNPVLIIRVGAKERKGGGDSIISPISPVNTMGTKLVQDYSEQEVENPETGEFTRVQGHQNPESAENGRKDVLESEASDGFGTLGWSQAGQVETLETSLNSGEELEIKA
jgi:hypothetical protein